MTLDPFGGRTPEFLARVRARMAEIDRLPRDIRECVHEFGWTVVKAFLDCGVTKARHIRHLVSTVREEGAYGNGARNRLTIETRP